MFRVRIQQKKDAKWRLGGTFKDKYKARHAKIAGLPVYKDTLLEITDTETGKKELIYPYALAEWFSLPVAR